MITQYSMKLDSSLPASAGYPLYAALLEQSPRDFGDLVHNLGTTPISQYVCNDEWRISLLGEEANLAMADILENLESLELGKLHKTVRITQLEKRTLWSADDFWGAAMPGKLTFVTPTAFKSGGAYQLLPTQRLLLQSLIQKWNNCFGDNCFVDDTEETLALLSHQLRYTGIRLESTGYSLKNTTIPGALGTIRIQPDADSPLLGALLRFGAFSGVGIKTALGMGGLLLE